MRRFFAIVRMFFYWRSPHNPRRSDGTVSADQDTSVILRDVWMRVTRAIELNLVVHSAIRLGPHDGSPSGSNRASPFTAYCRISSISSADRLSPTSKRNASRASSLASS